MKSVEILKQTTHHHFKYPSQIIEYDVHHIQWPAQKTTIENLELNYPRFSHLINNQPSRAHYSSGVQVLTWGKKKLPIIDI